MIVWWRHFWRSLHRKICSISVISVSKSRISVLADDSYVKIILCSTNHALKVSWVGNGIFNPKGHKLNINHMVGPLYVTLSYLWTYLTKVNEKTIRGTRWYLCWLRFVLCREVSSWQRCHSLDDSNVWHSYFANRSQSPISILLPNYLTHSTPALPFGSFGSVVC
jgi:hypothetical protein